MSDWMPGCKEPEGFDLGLALWHIFLAPVLTQVSGSCLKSPSLLSRVLFHHPPHCFLISICQVTRQLLPRWQDMLLWYLLTVSILSQGAFPHSSSCAFAAATSYEHKRYPDNTGRHWIERQEASALPATHTAAGISLSTHFFMCKITGVGPDWPKGSPREQSTHPSSSCSCD